MKTPYYKITESVMIDYENDKMTIVNLETGISVVGNRHAYEILTMMQKPSDIQDVIDELCKKYPESQHSRIAKSVPRVIDWALERKIIEPVIS